MSDFLSCVLIEDWESLGACLWLSFRYVVVIVGLSLDGRGDIGKSLDWELRTLRCAFVALHNSRPLLTTKEWPPSASPLHVLWEISCDSIMLMLLGVATSESMIPRPCFHHCNTICAHVYHLFACCTFYYRFILLCFATPIIHILPSLRRTSAPIQLLVVLGVLGTQETSCILVAGLLERDHLQPLLPWVR